MNDAMGFDNGVGQNANPDYRIWQARLDGERFSIDAWKQCNAQFGNTIHVDPEWLLELYCKERENVHVFFLERGRDLKGVVPFSFKRTYLRCRLGDITVAKIPQRRLSLVGGHPNMPEKWAVCDMLWKEVIALAPTFDAIYLESIRVDSVLWRYINDSPLIKQWFYVYSVAEPFGHSFIRVAGSFAEYMRKFSPKTRKNRLREVKKLRDRGNLQLTRITGLDEVDTFVDAAAEISRKNMAV